MNDKKEKLMSKKCDIVLVVDLEATCWDGPPPKGEESEIIEIGICPLEVGSGQRLERRSLLIRPERSRVSPFCTQLTTLTQADVDAGISFEEACEILRKEYRSRDRVWASFGDYDRNQVQSQCQSFSVGYPFGSRHLNVKTLFALVHALPHEIGMAEALRHLGHEMDGTHHRGHDDAWNIAGILAELLGRGRG
jgi:inhibitor of KinA sporulation pathway (predicted exonuclease)